MGIGIIIDGSGPGTGPILPFPLHNNGVTGATHRFAASRTGVAVGGSVTSISDLIGNKVLTQNSTIGTDTLLQETGGDQYLSRTFSATVSGRKLATATANNTDIAAPFTVAALVRQTGSGPNFIRVNGYRLQRSGNGQWGLAASTGTGTGLVNLAATDNWSLVFGLCDGANSRLAVGATVSANAGTITQADPAISGILEVFHDGTATEGTVQQIAEVNIWPGLLDATQRAAHYTAMKAAYGFLA